uniref:GNAT family N-acetyltransferase n=1 Tax=Stenotrophomonas pavanii TaxID=487698 RepID=UPI0039C6A582
PPPASTGPRAEVPRQDAAARAPPPPPRQGLGRELALARLRQAEADPSIKRITLSTSQHTQGFYAGLGFQVTRIVSNGHGAGIDAVEMERRV